VRERCCGEADKVKPKKGTEARRNVKVEAVLEEMKGEKRGLCPSTSGWRPRFREVRE
jgi:hypothetical protein